MKDTQLTLREVRGPLDALNKNLTSKDAKEWLSALNKFLRKENPWKEVVKKTKKLLKSLGTVMVPATKKFIFKDEFVKGKNDINWTGKNLVKWFSNIVEEPIEKTKFRKSLLLERSVDNPIIKKLGGRQKVKAYFSQILSLMNNVLKRDGTVYIFYAETDVFSKDEEHLAYENEKGKKVVLRAVSVYWDASGWRVNAYIVEFLFRWDVGFVVFSRNSC